eukprot:TRINITY_DN16850_c0_g2_i1.p1 TRINITY_DN16850_c0_g2~~TRINITY_DN16850_c0_g2_i1.p1  ORF type:complete len:239 (+),score=22.81 TRINITY_DN16850_c0_g2_i1:59-775(+)
MVRVLWAYDCFFFFQAEDGIRDAQESRGLGDVYKRQNSKTLPLRTTPGLDSLGMARVEPELESGLPVPRHPSRRDSGSGRRIGAQLVRSVLVNSHEFSPSLDLPEMRPSQHLPEIRSESHIDYAHRTDYPTNSSTALRRPDHDSPVPVRIKSFAQPASCQAFVPSGEPPLRLTDTGYGRRPGDLLAPRISLLRGGHRNRRRSSLDGQNAFSDYVTSINTSHPIFDTAHPLSNSSQKYL